MTVGIYMKDVIEAQAVAFRAWVAEKGFTDVVEYRDVTPVKGRYRNRERMRLIDDVREGKLDIVFVISLEQIGSGPLLFLLVSTYLRKHGVRLVSQSEPWADLSDQDFALVYYAYCRHTDEEWESSRGSQSRRRARRKRGNSGSVRKNTKNASNRSGTGKQKVKGRSRERRTAPPVFRWFKRAVSSLLRRAAKPLSHSRSSIQRNAGDSD